MVKSYARRPSTGSRDLHLTYVLDLLIMSTPSLMTVIYIPVGTLALTVSFMTTTAIFAVSAGTEILK